MIVTNNHVVEGFNTVTVHTAAGDEMQGKVVGADATLDLAVVKVDKTGLPTLQLGDSDTLQVGDGVVAIGNALGLSEGSGATVTTGIISGLDRVVDVGNETLFNAIQTDAAINPGNSGGPLVDMNGRVIGINTAIASPDTSNNVGFAISISSAKPSSTRCVRGRRRQIAFLGVTSETLTPATAKELGVDPGAVVADVASGSGADKAGIKKGDVIVEIDGTKITSVERRRERGAQAQARRPDRRRDRPERQAADRRRSRSASARRTRRPAAAPIPCPSGPTGPDGACPTTEPAMAMEPEELEGDTAAGHVKVVYTGPVAPHWEIHRVFGDQHSIDEFRQRRHGAPAAAAGLRPAVPPQPRTRRARRRTRAPHPRVGPRRRAAE